MTMRAFSILLIGVLLIFGNTSPAAAAAPFKISVSGAGLPQPIEITNLRDTEFVSYFLCSSHHAGSLARRPAFTIAIQWTAGPHPWIWRGTFYPAVGDEPAAVNIPDFKLYTSGTPAVKYCDQRVAGTKALSVLATYHVPVTILERVPHGCPASPSPKTISPDFGKGIGSSPVWAVGFSDGITLHVGNPKWVTYTPYGWTRKILWVMEPGYLRPVTLRGTDLLHGRPLWFQIGMHNPSTSPTLNPQKPGIPIQHDHWTEFPSYLFIPKAGCYFLEARWPGGKWRQAFAAGR